MTISAIENGTKVVTVTGREGKVQVTRRERKIISEGGRILIDVLGNDGLVRKYYLNELKVIEPEENDACPFCVGRCTYFDD